MQKATTSFRLSEATRKKIKEMAALLKESDTEVLERAVDALYSNREAVLREDVEVRLKKAKEGLI